MAGILVDIFFCCHLVIVWYVIRGEDCDVVYKYDVKIWWFVFRVLFIY